MGRKGVQTARSVMLAALRDVQAVAFCFVNQPVFLDDAARPEAFLLVIIMKPALSDVERIATKLVNESVLLGDAPRPKTLTVAFQRLRLATPRERGANTLL